MHEYKNKISQKPITIILLSFILCSIFHYFEVLIIRTDETFLSDNFINKIVGIIVLAVILKLLHYSWHDIGFRADKLKYLGYGLLVGLFCFIIAYGAEYFILYFQNLSPSFEWYVSGFSLTGEVIRQTSFVAFLICILFNIINVVMEEGVFRGLFIKLAAEKLSFVKANWFAALLFGLWHLSLPVRSLIDGQITVGKAAFMGMGYVIFAAIMAMKWGLWLRNTKCLWFGLSEHFFNNTIGNLLHVSSISGYDEMQIIRILIAQMISLAITLIINYRTKQKLIFITDDG